MSNPKTAIPATHGNPTNPATRAKTKNVKLLEKTLTKDVLLAYRDLVVPPGASRYHRRFRGQWLAEKWKNTGSWKKLDDYALRRHLMGDGYFIAVRWALSGLVRHAVIDIDSPLKHSTVKERREQPELVEDADDLMHQSLVRVVRALGDVPHVTVRSSTTRGLHVYIFFDRAYPAVEVNQVIEARLGEARLGPGGVVDMVFPSNQALRLPLGAGSCILDDNGRQYGDGPPPPVDAKQVAWKPLPEVAKRFAALGQAAFPGVFILRRDVLSSLATLANLAAARRVSLSALGGVVGGVLGKGVVWSTPTSSGSGAGSGSGSGSTGPALVSSAGHPLATSGHRFKETRELVLLLCRGGLSKAAGMMEVEDWLRRSAVAGTSKELTGADARRLQVFVKDAAGAWDWLEQHPLAVVVPKRVVALSNIAGLVPRSRRTPSSPSTPPASPTFDRDLIRAAVTLADEARLTAVEDRRLRDKARLLVGLLRLAEREHGPLTAVSIASVVFDRIVGGRPFVGHGWGTPTPIAVRVVLAAILEQLGYATRVDFGMFGRRASLFKVTMPSGESDVESSAADVAPGHGTEYAAE